MHTIVNLNSHQGTTNPHCHTESRDIVMHRLKPHPHPCRSTVNCINSCTRCMIMDVPLTERVNTQCVSTKKALLFCFVLRGGGFSCIVHALTLISVHGHMDMHVQILRVRVCVIDPCTHVHVYVWTKNCCAEQLRFSQHVLITFFCS